MGGKNSKKSEESSFSQTSEQGSIYDPNIIRPTKHIPSQHLNLNKPSPSKTPLKFSPIDPKTERTSKLNAIIQLLASSEQLQYLLEDQSNMEFASSQFKEWVNCKLLSALLNMSQDKQSALQEAVRLIESILDGFALPQHASVDEAFLFLMVVTTTVKVIHAHQRSGQSAAGTTGLVHLSPEDFYSQLLQIFQVLISTDIGAASIEGTAYEPLIRSICADVYKAGKALPTPNLPFGDLYSQAAATIQGLKTFQRADISNQTRKEIQTLLFSGLSEDQEQGSAIKDERIETGVNQLLDLWATQVTSYFLSASGSKQPLSLDAFVPDTLNIPPVFRSATFSLGPNLSLGTYELMPSEFKTRIKEKYLQLYINNGTVLTKKVRAVQMQTLAFQGFERVGRQQREKYLPKFRDLIKGANDVLAVNGSRLIGDLIHDYDVTVVYEKNDRLFYTGPDTLLSDVDPMGDMGGYRFYFVNGAAQKPTTADTVRIILKADFARDDLNNLNHMIICNKSDTFRVVADALNTLTRNTGYNEPIKEDFLANLGKYVTVSAKKHLTIPEKRTYTQLSKELNITRDTKISDLIQRISAVDQNRPSAPNMVDLIVVLNSSNEATENYLPLFESVSSEVSADARVLCDVKLDFDRFINLVFASCPSSFEGAHLWTDQQVMSKLPALIFVPFGPLSRLVQIPTEFTVESLKEVVAQRELGISNQYRASAFIYKDQAAGVFIIKSLVANTKDQVVWTDPRTEKEKTTSLHNLVAERVEGVLFVRKEPEI